MGDKKVQKRFELRITAANGGQVDYSRWPTYEEAMFAKRVIHRITNLKLKLKYSYSIVDLEREAQLTREAEARVAKELDQLSDYVDEHGKPIPKSKLHEYDIDEPKPKTESKPKSKSKPKPKSKATITKTDDGYGDLVIPDQQGNKHIITKDQFVELVLNWVKEGK